MNHTHHNWQHRLWRMAVILLGTLVLCSCRSDAQHSAAGPQPSNSPTAPATAHTPHDTAPTAALGMPTSATLASTEATGQGVVPAAFIEPETQPQTKTQTQNIPRTPMPSDDPCIMGMPGMESGVPLPYTAAGPWIPPGIVPPWPADEYLRDGGNVGPPVAVGKNGELIGLQMEDTVARYKTLDGRTLVVPSNEVELYSPRFNAVRQVVDVEVDQQRHRAAGVAEPVKMVIPRTSEPVVTNTLGLQPIRGIATNPAGQLRAAWSTPRNTPIWRRGRSTAASAPSRTSASFARAFIKATTRRFLLADFNRPSPGSRTKA